MVPWFDDNDNNDIIMMMMMMRTMIMWCRGSAEEWADAWRPTTHAITSQMQQFTPDFHRKKLFCYVPEFTLELLLPTQIPLSDFNLALLSLV